MCLTCVRVEIGAKKRGGVWEGGRKEWRESIKAFTLPSKERMEERERDRGKGGDNEQEELKREREKETEGGWEEKERKRDQTPGYRDAGKGGEREGERAGPV